MLLSSEKISVTRLCRMGWVGGMGEKEEEEEEEEKRYAEEEEEQVA